MLTIDTNVVVRYLMRDDEDPYNRAVQCIEGSACLLLDTVLLETGWVLESAFDLPREAVVDVLSRFLRLSTIHVHDAARLACALRWYEAGLDLADAPTVEAP